MVKCDKGLDLLREAFLSSPSDRSIDNPYSCFCRYLRFGLGRIVGTGKAFVLRFVSVAREYSCMMCDHFVGGSCCISILGMSLLGMRVKGMLRCLACLRSGRAVLVLEFWNR